MAIMVPGGLFGSLITTNSEKKGGWRWIFEVAAIIGLNFLK